MQQRLIMKLRIIVSILPKNWTETLKMFQAFHLSGAGMRLICMGWKTESGTSTLLWSKISIECQSQKNTRIQRFLRSNKNQLIKERSQQKKMSNRHWKVHRSRTLRVTKKALLKARLRKPSLFFQTRARLKGEILVSSKCLLPSTQNTVNTRFINKVISVASTMIWIYRQTAPKGSQLLTLSGVQ
jgi:hypothetical protein